MRSLITTTNPNLFEMIPGQRHHSHRNLAKALVHLRSYSGNFSQDLGVGAISHFLRYIVRSLLPVCFGRFAHFDVFDVAFTQLSKILSNICELVNNTG